MKVVKPIVIREMVPFSERAYRKFMDALLNGVVITAQFETYKFVRGILVMVGPPIDGWFEVQILPTHETYSATKAAMDFQEAMSAL